MKKDRAYIQDILDAIIDIEEFTKDVTRGRFLRNKEKQYAVLRALEITGEATKKLSKELKAKYREIPWKDIAGMRDKLIHMYFGVDLDLVWETITIKLPEFKKQIIKVQKEVSENT